MKRSARRAQGMLRLNSLDDLSKTGAKPRGAVEADILPTIIAALRSHPRVAWAERVNKGKGRLQRADGSLSYFMAWGYEHALDITGQMRDGRRLEVEVKRPGNDKFEPEQEATIAGIRGAGGVSFVARSVADVFREIPQ